MMKVILKTYKYRMYPNKEQQQMLAKYFGSVRFVYNHFLAERKQQYEKKASVILSIQMVNAYYFLLKKITTGQHSKYLRILSTLNHIRKYCAQYIVTMAIKYGILTYIAIMMKIHAGIIFLAT